MPDHTPEEIAKLHPQDPVRHAWHFDPATSIQDLQQYIHLISYRDYGPRELERNLALTALQVRISDEATKSAQKLEAQTTRLVQQVAVLGAIADEQRALAVKLDRQTKWLIYLTIVLALFTIGLFGVALEQTKIMFKQDAATSNRQ